MKSLKNIFINKQNLSDKKKRHSNLGFSLLEVLVATVITTILVIALSMTLNTATKNWTKSSKVQDSFREARAALEIIKRDMKSLYRNPIYNSDGDQVAPIYIRCSRYNGGTLDSFGTKDIYYKNTPLGGYGSANVAFISAMPVELQPETDDVGDITTVGYFVELMKDDTSVTGKTRYIQKLYRYTRGSKDTLRFINNITGSSKRGLFSDFPLFKNKSYYNDGSDNYSEPSPYPETHKDNVVSDEPIAINVVRFDIKPYYLNNNVYAEIDNDEGWPTLVDYTNERFIPSYIEVTLRVTSNEIAKRISDLTTTGSPTHWRGESTDTKSMFIGDNSDVDDYEDDRDVKTFTTRIYLK